MGRPMLKVLLVGFLALEFAAILARQEIFSLIPSFEWEFLYSPISRDDALTLLCLVWAFWFSAKGKDVACPIMAALSLFAIQVVFMVPISNAVFPNVTVVWHYIVWMCVVQAAVWATGRYLIFRGSQ